MDYVLVAKDMITPGSEKYFTEQFLPLEALWTFRPRGPASPAEDSAYQLTPPPVGRTGYITFGSLNNTAKLNLPLLRVWRRILEAVPGSKLLIHVKGSTGGNVEVLEQAGLDPARLEVVDSLSQLEYTRNYQRIDIALDPFPYGGGTTTCESLWMGAPVITLPMKTAVSRAGLSILTNVGLTDLIARSQDDYLRIATALASSSQRLTQLRASLRDKMQHSALMNAPQFARDLESLYRQAWQSWCNAR